MSHMLQIFSVLIAFLFKADFLKQMFNFYIVNYFSFVVIIQKLCLEYPPLPKIIIFIYTLF